MVEPLINFKTITEEIHNNGGKIHSKTINNNTSKDLSENGKIPLTRQKADTVVTWSGLLFKF